MSNVYEGVADSGEYEVVDNYDISISVKNTEETEFVYHDSLV